MAHFASDFYHDIKISAFTPVTTQLAGDTALTAVEIFSFFSEPPGAELSLLSLLGFAF